MSELYEISLFRTRPFSLGYFCAPPYFDDSVATSTLNITTIGVGDQILMTDPLTVEAYNTTGTAKFIMNINSGPGEFVWGGRNVVDANGGSTVTFKGGSTTTLTPDFTLTTTAGINYRTGSEHDAYGMAGNTNPNGNTNSLAVVIENGSTLLFDLARDENVAMFDFTNVTGERVFTVEDGALFGVANAPDTSRQIVNVDKLYMIADGIEEWEVDTGMDNFEPISPIQYFEKRVNAVDGTHQLWTSVRFDSQYDYLFHENTNTANASAALNAVIGDTNIVSTTEFDTIIANANAVTAEYYASRGVVAMQSVGSLANQAVFYNLIQPYHWNAANKSTGGSYYLGAAPRAGLTQRTWGGYLGEFGLMDAHSQREKYQTTAHGLFVGTDWLLTRNTIFGIYGGFTDETLKYDAITSRVDSDGIQVGIFGHRHLGYGNVLSGDFGYAHFNNNGRRVLGDYTASGSFNQNATTFGIGWKKQNRNDFCEILPFANLRYTYLDQDRMRENGNSATVMALNGMDGNSFVSRLGTGFAKRFGNLEAKLDVGWAHEYGDTELGSVGMYQLGGDAFNVSSAVLDRDRLELGVRLGRSCRRSTSVWSQRIGYDLAVGENTTLHAVFATASVQF